MGKNWTSEQLTTLKQLVAEAVEDGTRNAIETAFVKGQQSTASVVKPSLASFMELEQPDALNRNESKAGNKTLEEENERLRQEILQWKQKDLEKDLKITNLHKIIQESSTLDDNAPNDDDVERRFSELRNRILQVVKKHFSRKWRRHGSSSSATIDDLWSMAIIADALWSKFFSPKATCFGFSPHSDECLGGLENEFENVLDVPFASVVEWRVRAVQLAELSKIDDETAFGSSTQEFVRNLLTNHLLAKHPLKEPNAAVAALTEIHDKAFRLSLLFRANKTEYVWLQNQSGSIEITEDQVEIVGTAGFRSIGEAKGRFKIVFGAVGKAAAHGGRCKDGLFLLRNAEIMLGPFNNLT
ncbi:hypothetical protein NA57DRAFT_72511 [Rhizodiscina lignyota]|uniref:Uncharacterized protein n=1 Tax=Rhizodiscina lignyota TaxID=1504668 RepID=A0A9P4IL52_9PEZI|nr:hypothetical protein NA57DRAFT_72511 [Rhizodiscina lignyota]